MRCDIVLQVIALKSHTTQIVKNLLKVQFAYPFYFRRHVAGLTINALRRNLLFEQF